MEFSFFQPSSGQTFFFVALVFIVHIGVLRILNATYKLNPQKLGIVLGVFAFWLIGHALLGNKELLLSDSMPPPIFIYFFGTLFVGVLLVFSKIGKRIAQDSPLRLFVALQIFRLPLEILLSSLAQSGNLPYEMTYHGLNFDILTGASALVLVLLSRKKEIPNIVYGLWNIMGLSFLAVIGVVAPLSSPVPIRVFDSGPPLVLAMFFPWTWIVSVCVFFAFTGHLLLFRALWMKRKNA